MLKFLPPPLKAGAAAGIIIIGLAFVPLVL
jgi:hypothetical protein